MMKPTIGRIVHYQLTERRILPAIITAVHSEECINLQVFGDPSSGDPNVIGRTSVVRGERIGEWDWMAYQKEKAAAGDHNSESAEPRP